MRTAELLLAAFRSGERLNIGEINFLRANAASVGATPAELRHLYDLVLLWDAMGKATLV